MHDDIEFFENCPECGEPVDYCTGHPSTVTCACCATALINADTSAIEARGYHLNGWNTRAAELGNVCVDTEFTARYSGDYVCELCEFEILADETVYRFSPVN